MKARQDWVSMICLTEQKFQLLCLTRPQIYESGKMDGNKDMYLYNIKVIINTCMYPYIKYKCDLCICIQVHLINMHKITIVNSLILNIYSTSLSYHMQPKPIPVSLILCGLLHFCATILLKNTRGFALIPSLNGQGPSWSGRQGDLGCIHGRGGCHMACYIITNQETVSFGQYTFQAPLPWPSIYIPATFKAAP